MGLPVTEFTHAGREYKTTLFPATHGLVMMPKIIVLFGREITTLLLSTDEAGLKKLLEDRETLAAMLHTISKNAVAGDGEGLLLLHEMMRQTTYKATLAGGNIVDASVHGDFDLLFSGEYMDLFTVAIRVARASFAKPSSAK
jgi:hypothetical protein